MRMNVIQTHKHKHKHKFHKFNLNIPKRFYEKEKKNQQKMIFSEFVFWIEISSQMDIL